MGLLLASAYLLAFQIDGVQVRSSGGTDKPLPVSLKPDPRNPATIYCLAAGIKLLQEPSPNSKPSGYPEPRYLEGFFFVDEYQDRNQRKYYLLNKGEPGTIDFKYCGWIPADLALQGEGCMIDKPSGIQRKALIVNTPETLADKTKIEEVKPRKGPGLNYETVDSLRYYNILFVFNESKDAATGEKHLCLGFQPYFDRLSNGKNPIAKTIAGWIPEKSVYLWNTREAIQWQTNSNSVRKEPVKVFRTREDAIRYSEKPGAVNSPKPIIEEIFDKNGRSPDWKKDKSRYPLLTMTTQEQLTDDSFGQLSKVGIIGDFVGGDGKIERGTLDEMREKLAVISEEIKSIELLLVIDDTESMDNYFKNVVPDWINRIITTLQGQGDQNIRISLCFYNDIDQDLRNGPIKYLDDAVHYEHWEQMDPKGQAKVIDNLRMHSATRGGDSPEQLLHGLKTGLIKCSKGLKTKARKICILLGDTGNHLQDNCGQNVQDEITQIANLLTPQGGIPWEFMALQVPPDKPGQQNIPEYINFQKQAREILTKIKSRRQCEIARIQKENKNLPGLELPEPAIGAVFTAKDIDGVGDILDKRYQDTIKVQRELQEQVLKLARGSLSAGAKILPELQEVLIKANIDVSMLKYNGQQIFIEGWVWDNNSNKEKQIQTNFLLSKKEIEDLSKLLGGINSVPQTIGGIKEHLYRKLLDLANGDKEKIVDLKIAEIFEEKTGLKTKSKFFDLLEKDITDAKMPGVIDELNRVKKKEFLLNDILARKKCEYKKAKIKLDNGKKEDTWEKFKEMDIDRIFKMPGSETIEWVWIDSEEEFP
jgi:hypothetical protein